MQPLYTQLVLTHSAAMRMLEAAVQKAEQLGVAVQAAVVDQGGNLKAFVRMDGSPLLSGTIAQNKAYTAAAFGIATSEWYPMIEKEPALLHGIVHTDKLVVFGGGLPVCLREQLIGGVGVSGGSVDQDVACAEAALAEFRRIV